MRSCRIPAINIRVLLKGFSYGLIAVHIGDLCAYRLQRKSDSRSFELSA